MDLKALVIGYGSAGERHANILNRELNIVNLKIFSKRKLHFKTIDKMEDIKKYNPDYFIISTPTSEHLKFVKFIEKNFSKKIVLIEKPIFSLNEVFKTKKNKYFVGYQLRFHPVINKLKQLAKQKKLLNLNIISNSYLPNWRKRNYKKTYSASKKFGGGVLLDLSHEIDYLNWIFPNLKYNYILRKKISTLKINTEDISILNGHGKDNFHFQINLNYFSRYPKRLIFLDAENFSFYGDLINNYFKITYVNIVKKKYFHKYNQNYLTFLMHKSIIKKNYKNLCNFNSGLNVLKIIKKLHNQKQNK